MDIVVSKPIHTVQVRELVEFVLRTGDLESKRQFVGSDRALAGIRGHQKIQRSRPAGYQTEIPVDLLLEAGEFSLQIRGRIDGLLTASGEVLLEEIKTVQGAWDELPDPLHWAQAKTYGYIYAMEQGLGHLMIQLVYLHLETGKVTEFRQEFSLVQLTDFFTETTAIYISWIRELYRWRQSRNQSVAALIFPFKDFRPGQRELAVASYRVLANGGRLFLAAPTGIGKTISVLFPAIKALGEGRLERIFYLTARTVGRAVAEKALADLRLGGLKLRAVTLTAREKLCMRDGQPCDVLTCPLARGYYDRVKPAIREALAQETITRATLETVGQKHQVCPFALSLDVSVWADAIICDYNYVFDPKVYLRRHFAEAGGDYGFLVDEAHNLVDRAREMFSADLDGPELLENRRAIKTAVPKCAKALLKLNAEIHALFSPHGSPQAIEHRSDTSVELNLFPQNRGAPDHTQTHIVRPDLPAKLLESLEAAIDAAETCLVKNESAPFREALLALYFRMLSFRRTAELYDERYTTIIKKNGRSVTVRLFCVDPSFLLRQALTRGKAAIFFSATLTPMDYFRNLLGGQSGDSALQLASPFPPENLAVFIQDRIQTHLKARVESLAEVVEAIDILAQGKPGNYLIYFPSYQYLNNALREFQIRQPSIPVLIQRPGMTEPEREDFLAAFAIEHGRTLLGFAVLGGIFGEGIDLVGERLIGAVIVGVGLPQLCVERDLIRQHFQQQNVSGFDYAYTFPGMNRVLQAMGRVIRTGTDRGVVLLIDARFNEMRYRRLFPAWWKFSRIRNSTRLREAVADFWKSPA